MVSSELVLNDRKIRRLQSPAGRRLSSIILQLRTLEEIRPTRLASIRNTGKSGNRRIVLRGAGGAGASENNGRSDGLPVNDD